MIRQGRLEWRPELAEADLAKVAIGDAVNLRDATGQTVAGRVRAVSPGVDSSTRTGTIYADLPQPGTLKAGTFVEGRIITSVSDGLLVPSSSVVTRDGYAYVFTVDDAKVAHRVRVTIGSTQDDRIEVLTGLKPGDAVVATGAGFLGDGDKVRVVATNAASVANQAGVAP